MADHNSPWWKDLDKTAAQADAAARTLGVMVPTPVEKIDVKVTAYDSGTQSYTWKKQHFDVATGAYIDDPVNLTGSPTYMPLKEQNGGVVSTFPYFTKAWQRLATGGVGPVWEFQAAAGTLFVRFSLPSPLATTDASKANCNVIEFWGGSSPGGTITVWNLQVSSNYLFSGATGHVGLATYDATNNKYRIIQMECP